ncbi:MAG: ribonuclease HI family protein [Endomicrobiia bacterium]
MIKYKIYFDGNKSLEGVSCSYLLIDEKGRSKETTILLPKETTVPEAEYNGLIKSLEDLQKEIINLNDIELEIYGDSQLVINQILGKYECKKPQLRILRSTVRSLLDKFKSWKIEWVDRNRNLVK